MSIRFVKLIVSIVWKYRYNQDTCFMAILETFAHNGNVIAQKLLDYHSFDCRYEIQSYIFTGEKIVKIWRKDIK